MENPESRQRTRRLSRTRSRCRCRFSRASAAVNNLKRFHEKKKRGLKPHSLYLDHIIRKSVSSHNRRESHSRSHRDIYVIKVKILLPMCVCDSVCLAMCNVPERILTIDQQLVGQSLLISLFFIYFSFICILPIQPLTLWSY